MSDSETDLCAGLSMDKDEMFLKPARKTRRKMSKPRLRGRCDNLCHLHRGTMKGMQFGMAAAQIAGRPVEYRFLEMAEQP